MRGIVGVEKIAGKPVTAKKILGIKDINNMISNNKLIILVQNFIDLQTGENILCLLKRIEDSEFLFDCDGEEVVTTTPEIYSYVIYLGGGLTLDEIKKLKLWKTTLSYVKKIPRRKKPFNIKFIFDELVNVDVYITGRKSVNTEKRILDYILDNIERGYSPDLLLKTITEAMKETGLKVIVDVISVKFP